MSEANIHGRLVAAMVCVAGLLVTAACSASTETTAAAPTSSSLATPAVPAASADAFPDDLQVQFQQVLDDTRESFGFPGAIAGVWSPAGSWVGVTGTAGSDTDRAPAREDHSRIGSLTKTFTGMSLLQQVDQGLVSLDDPIEKYVPGVPNGESATLRMLASMTSGIPSYSFSEDFQKAYFLDTARAFTPQELVDYVKGVEPLFPAGTAFDYSNTNTILLGMVIEQVTGKPMAQVLQEGILAPLGLAQTSFPGTSPAIPDPYLSGVTEQGVPEGVKDATNWNPSWGFTAGEMISQIDDLRVWGYAMGTGAGLISPELQQARVVSLASAPPNGLPGNLTYGLGYASFDGWLGHNGSLPGYTSYVVFDPKSETVIAVLANSDIKTEGVSPADAIGHALEDIMEQAG